MITERAKRMITFYHGLNWQTAYEISLPDAVLDAFVAAGWLVRRNDGGPFTLFVYKYTPLGYRQIKRIEALEAENG